MFASTSFTSKTVSGLNNANLNYLNVYNDANFYGTTTFYGPVNITVPTSFVNLTVTNQTTLNNLTVSGVTIFNGAVTFNSTVTLANVTVNNLTVNGTSTLKGNVAAGTSIAPVNTDTFGPVELTGTLLQTGVSTFVGRVNVSVLLSTLTALAVTTGQTTLKDTFITNLVVSVSSDFSGPFRSHGYVILYDTLTVIGLINGTNQELAGYLTVTGLTTLNGGLTLTGLLTVTGNLEVTGTLEVLGNTTLAALQAGNTTVGTLQAGNTTTGNLTSLITNTGALTVTGGAAITGVVGITGATTITGNLTTTGIFTSSGAAVISGTISLNGLVTLVGAVVAPGGISMTASTLDVTLRTILGSIFLITNFAGASINLNSFSTVNITGSGFVVGTLASPVTSTLNGNVTITIGTFFVGSTTTAVNQLNYGNITIGDATHLFTLAVNGTTNLGTLNALATTANTLTVNTTSTFTGLATFNGGISISGSITLGALTVTSLTVNTTSTFTGLAKFNGGIASTTITSSGLSTLNSLLITTTSTFTGVATFNNTLNVGGLVGSLNVGNSSTPVPSNLFGAVTIGVSSAASTLDVYGPTVLRNGTGGLGSLLVTSTLTVQGTALLSGNSTMNLLATFNNGLTVVSGGVTVTNGGIGVVAGPATFLGGSFNVASGASPASITMYGSAIGGMLFSSAGAITITATTGTTFFGNIIASNLSTFTGLATFSGGLTVSGGATIPTINGNTTVNGTLTIGPGGATRDLAVYGTAFLGAVSQAGTANLDRINFTTLWLSGTLPCFASGTWTPILRATAGVSFAYTTQSGFYMNLGQSFFLNITLKATYTGTSVNSIDISLPFTTSTPSSVLIVATDGIIAGTFNPNGIVYMQTFAASGYASLYNPFTLTSYSYSRAVAGSPISILASVILQN